MKRLFVGGPKDGDVVDMEKDLLSVEVREPGWLITKKLIYSRRYVMNLEESLTRTGVYYSVDSMPDDMQYTIFRACKNASSFV